jgi:dihydroxyacetone kinase
VQKGDLQAAAQAAQQGAEATAKMAKAGAGRSSYVNKENLDGVMDPAVAVARQKYLTYWRSVKEAG